MDATGKHVLNSVIYLLGIQPAIPPYHVQRLNFFGVLEIIRDNFITGYRSLEDRRYALTLENIVIWHASHEGCVLQVAK
jgi:hypothetical protein